MVEATGAPHSRILCGVWTTPRIDRTKRHKLLDIVTIAISGTICGADNWVDIELFGNSQRGVVQVLPRVAQRYSLP